MERRPLARISPWERWEPKVGGARVVVLHAVVTAGGLDEVQHRLEFADHEHVAVDAQEVFLGEVAFLEFVLDGLLVLHHGDFREHDLVLFRTQGDIGVNVQ